MTYRDPEPEYVDVHDWDIVLMHGTVHVVGMSGQHLDNCVYKIWGSRCGCRDGKPRRSSPVVCSRTRRVLQESRFSGEPTTGEARHLLDAVPGNTILVESGKSYRLVGPRRADGHEGFKSGSIFRVYPEEDSFSAEAEEGRGWLGRLFHVLLPRREERMR